jgi:hypothetical protein
MIEPVFRVAFRHGQEFFAAGQAKHFAIAVQRPGQTAGPGAVVAQTLMRGLTQEFAGGQVERAFVGCGTMGPHNGIARGSAVGFGDAQQFFVTGFAGGIKNNRHVHHDVDEQRFRRHERLQILPFLHESHGQRAAGLNQHLV